MDSKVGPQKPEVAQQVKENQQVGPEAAGPTSTSIPPAGHVMPQALANPALLRPAQVLSLQHSSGNRAVTRLMGRGVQPKLTVGAAFDPLEQEADQVAEQVLAMPDRQDHFSDPPPPPVTPPAPPPNNPHRKANQEDEEELLTMRLVQPAPEPQEDELQTLRISQREAVPEEEEVQPERSSQDWMGRFEVEDSLEDQMRSASGGGAALPGDVRAFMEPRFGADFSGVRIHTDSRSAVLNRKISARAFTLGQDIFLGEGSYSPGSTDGRRLLAHELAHTVQQGAAVQRLALTSKELAEISSSGKKADETWNSLVAAVTEFEKIEKNDNKDSANQKKAAIQKVIDFSNAWKFTLKAENTTQADQERISAIENLLSDAMMELGKIEGQDTYNEDEKAKFAADEKAAKAVGDFETAEKLKLENKIKEAEITRDKDIEKARESIRKAQEKKLSAKTDKDRNSAQKDIDKYEEKIKKYEQTFEKKKTELNENYEQKKRDKEVDEQGKVGDAIRKIGENVLKRGGGANKSQSVDAMGAAQEEMYSSNAARARDLFFLFYYANADCSNKDVFQKIQSLLTGPAGMEEAFLEAQKRLNISEPKTLASEIRRYTMSPPKGSLMREYLMDLAQTGQISENNRLLLSLGVVAPGGDSDGKSAKDIIEKYLTTDLLTEKTPGSGADSDARNEQVQEIKDKIKALQDFLRSMKLPVIGEGEWADKKPWDNLSGDSKRQITTTFAFVQSAIKTGEAASANDEINKDDQGKAASEKNLTDAQNQLKKTAIERLLGYIKSMRSAVYTSAEDENKILDFVRQWKDETTALEQKFGMEPNSIGKEIITQNIFGMISGKGLSGDNIALVQDIVSGSVGSKYNRFSKNEEGASQKEIKDKFQSEGSLKVKQLIAVHHENTTVTTAGDINSLADDLVKIGQSDPNALLAYLLDLIPINEVTLTNGRKLDKKPTVADFAPPKTNENIQQGLNLDYYDREILINKGLSAVEKQLGIRKLEQEYIQFNQEKRAALEKIMAIFKYGPEVASTGKVYISLRQALTDRTYRTKALLKALAGITDKDRAMVSADNELRNYISMALEKEGDKEDKAKIEGILGFSLKVTMESQVEGFAGGKGASGRGLDVNAMTPKDDKGNINYDELASRWAATLTNNYHTFAQEAMVVGAAKTVVNTIASFGSQDVKPMLMTMFEAQGSIRRAVSQDPNAQGKVEEQVKAVIKLVKEKLSKNDQTDIAKVHPAAKNWLEDGNEIPLGGIVEKSRGLLGMDEALILNTIENASPKDLFENFADTDGFYRLYGQFTALMAGMDNVKDESERQARQQNAADLQTKLLAFTPGLKPSFIQYITGKKADSDTSSGLQRVVVEKASAKLAEAYANEPLFLEKISDVRNQISLLDKARNEKDGGIDKGSGFDLKGLSKGLSTAEGKASAEMLREQTHMQNTRSLRGLNTFVGGEKATLTESRANYLGKGRELIETRANKYKGDDKAGQEIEKQIEEKTKQLTGARKDYEVHEQAFLAARAQIQMYVSLAIQVLAGVISACLGVPPVWVTVTVDLVKNILLKVVEGAFDPERFSLAEAGWDVISSAVTSGVIAQATMSLNLKAQTTKLSIDEQIEKQIITQKISGISKSLNAVMKNTVFSKSEGEMNLDKMKAALNADKLEADMRNDVNAAVQKQNNENETQNKDQENNEKEKEKANNVLGAESNNADSADNAQQQASNQENNDNSAEKGQQNGEIENKNAEKPQLVINDPNLVENGQQLNEVQQELNNNIQKDDEEVSQNNEDALKKVDEQIDVADRPKPTVIVNKDLIADKAGETINKAVEVLANKIEINSNQAQQSKDIDKIYLQSKKVEKHLNDIKTNIHPRVQNLNKVSAPKGNFVRTRVKEYERIIQKEQERLTNQISRLPPKQRAKMEETARIYNVKVKNNNLTKTKQ